jgi:hypothetical protein
LSILLPFLSPYSSKGRRLCFSHCLSNSTLEFPQAWLELAIIYIQTFQLFLCYSKWTNFSPHMYFLAYFPYVEKIK